MPFLTQEQVRAVRLKGSTVVPVDRLGKGIRVALVSGSRAFQLRELQQAAAKERDVFVFMLQAACVDDDGNPFAREDAEQIFDLLTMDELASIVSEVTKSLGGKAKASQAPETSSSDSVSPSAGPTPTT